MFQNALVKTCFESRMLSYSFRDGTAFAVKIVVFGLPFMQRGGNDHFTFTATKSLHLGHIQEECKSIHQ